MENRGARGCAEATVEKVAGGFAFTEGPTCDADGNVLFTDQPNDRILKNAALQGRLSTLLQPAGRANGMDLRTRVTYCLRRREDRPVVHRAGRQDHCAARRVRQQGLERPQRCLGTSRRRTLLHRSVLSAALVDARRHALAPRMGSTCTSCFCRPSAAPGAGDHGHLTKPYGSIIGTPDGRSLLNSSKRTRPSRERHRA